jgi:hypothetical protein
MPVVNVQSPLYRNPAVAGGSVDSLMKRGNLIAAQETVANLSTDNTGSRYQLCSVMADALPDISTAFQVASWGYADIRIGTFANPAALVSVLRSAGAVVTPFAFGDARHGQRWWQVLGLTENPGGEIDLFVHAIANPTAAGTMRFRVASWIN